MALSSRHQLGGVGEAGHEVGEALVVGPLGALDGPQHVGPVAVGLQAEHPEPLPSPAS